MTLKEEYDHGLDFNGGLFMTTADVIKVNLLLCPIERTVTFENETFCDGQCFNNAGISGEYIWSTAGYNHITSGTNGVEFCRNLCMEKNYKYFGLQHGDWCNCGHTAPPAYKIANPFECNKLCDPESGNYTWCGAQNRMNIYRIEPVGADEECTSMGQVMVVGTVYLTGNLMHETLPIENGNETIIGTYKQFTVDAKNGLPIFKQEGDSEYYLFFEKHGGQWQIGPDYAAKDAWLKTVEYGWSLVEMIDHKISSQMIKGREVLKDIRLGEEWKIEFEFIQRKFSNGEENVFHFTKAPLPGFDGVNDGLCGSRYPAMFFDKGENLTLILATCLNGNKNHQKRISGKHSLNEWVSMKLGQKQRIDKKIWFFVEINGETYEEINTDPVSIDDLIVYMSDPWHNSAHAELRNFKIWTKSVNTLNPGKKLKS